MAGYGRRKSIQGQEAEMHKLTLITMFAACMGALTLAASAVPAPSGPPVVVAMQQG